MDLLLIRFFLISFLSLSAIAQQSGSDDADRASHLQLMKLTRPDPAEGEGPYQNGGWISPEYKWFFEYPLPPIPTKGSKM